MKEMVCPSCGAELTYEMKEMGVCFICGVNFAELAKSIAEEAKELANKIQKEKNQQLKEFYANFMITTGYNFEGYTIKKYLNIVHGEMVLGTGFLSEISLDVADFLGTNSNIMGGKLSQAKSIATEQMILTAHNIDANAKTNTRINKDI